MGIFCDNLEPLLPFLLLLLVGQPTATLSADGIHGENETAADEIFNLLQVNGTRMSLQQTDVLLAELWKRVSCTSSHCQCLSVNTVFSLLEAEAGIGLSKMELERAAPVILFFIHDVDEACSAKLTNYSIYNFTNWLRVDINRGDVISVYDNGDHDGNENHNDEHDDTHDEEEGSHDHNHDHNHDDEVHEEDEDSHDENNEGMHDEEEDDHDHSHEDEVHEDEDSHDENNEGMHDEEEDEHDHSHDDEVHEEDEDSHDENNEGMHDDEHSLSFRERLQGVLNDLNRNYSRHSLSKTSDAHSSSDETHNETPKHNDEHTHEGEEHQDDIEDDIECFDAYLLMKEERVTTNLITENQIQRIATHVILDLLKGYRIDRHCRTLPYSSEMGESLFSTLGGSTNTHISKRNFERLLSQLKIGAIESSEKHEEDADSDSHEGHNHRKKREVSTTHEIDTHTPFVPPQGFPQQCLSASDLGSIYGISPDGVSREVLKDLCPALIQQQITGACAPISPKKKDHVAPLRNQVFGYGFAAVTIICLASLVGLVLLPCLSPSVYKHVMSIFTGLAVGSLTADAFLHLIPVGYGLHAHGEEEHAHGDEVVLEPYMAKSLGLLAVTYAFFIFESLMVMITRKSAHRGHGHSHISGIHEQSKSDKYASKEENDGDGPSSESDQNEGAMKKKTGCSNVKPVVLMVVIGDALHNFADGLAIGAAFSFSIVGGVATSIAVLCHELPHELGDFAVLLGAGLKVKMAALVNLLSALTAYAGFFIGASISTDKDVQTWIFIISGGMFIYIALVELVPDLVNSQQAEKTRCRGFLVFILQSFGILAGVALVILIELFAEKITL